MCGGLVALALKDTYPAVTGPVLAALTGSGSPNSKQWNDAIESERSTTNAAGTFQLHLRTDAAAITRGDLLAAEYAAAGASGHTMVVGASWLDAAGVASSIPGVPTADRYRVSVIDSTATVHGAYASTLDSRYLAELGVGGAWVDDAGIGGGEIFLYADPLTGAVVGWTWSPISSVVYQGTDPAAASYRPLVAGWLEGPGL